MSHKTLVNGTVYEVDGGKTLIDGVAYSIDKGKTLAGGTVYEVGFGPSEATITITGDSWYFAVVTIDETEYTNCGNGVTLTVPIGTEITCFVQDNSYGGYGKIIVNGEIVASTEVGALAYTYTYTVAGDANIALTENIISGSQKGSAGTITITEQ